MVCIQAPIEKSCREDGSFFFGGGSRGALSAFLLDVLIGGFGCIMRLAFSQRCFLCGCVPRHVARCAFGWAGMSLAVGEGVEV